MNELVLTNESNAFLGDWIENDEGIFTTNLGNQIFLDVENATFVEFDWQNNVEDEFGPSAIAYMIDNSDWQTIELNDQAFRIEIQDAGKHALRIVTKGLTYIRGDYWAGKQRFQINKIASDGNITGGVPQKDFAVFVGDSITNGQKMMQESSRPKDHAPELSYGFEIADYFDLNPWLIAYGGTGITNKAKVNPPTGADFLWFSTKADKRPLHEDYNLKFIVANIGTNDTDATEKEFAFSLRIFNQELHKRFHNTPIYYLIPLNQNFADVYRELTPNFDNVKLIETAGWNVSLGDGTHPDKAGEEQLTQKILEELKKDFDA